jgi:twitching motility protein PilT
MESYVRALKRVLRQDPDIILIGEIRDSESAQIALSAAETEHLVLSTLHTLDATETINRMIDLFPPHLEGDHPAAADPDERRQGTCRGLRDHGHHRPHPGLHPRPRADTGQIQTAISEGEYYGMQTFDQALLKLIEEDRVSYEEALHVASRPQDFKLMVQSLRLGATR